MTSQPKPLREMTTEQLEIRRREMVGYIDDLKVLHVSEFPREQRLKHAAAMQHARRMLIAIEGELLQRTASAISQRAQEIVLPEQEQPEEKEHENP